MVIPAHRAEVTIERAVASARNQSVPPLEIRVGVDGEGDPTIPIAQRLGVGVIVIPKKNGSAARNAAAQGAMGDVICLLDADDAWGPGKIESHLRAHECREVGFVVDPARRIRPSGSQRGLNGAGPEGPIPWQSMLDPENWTCGSSISVRRSVWQRVGGFNEGLPGMQDIDFQLRVGYEAGGGYRLQESHTFYYLSNSGVSKRGLWREPMVKLLAESCAFLDPSDLARLRAAIALRNALQMGPVQFWSEMRWGRVPLASRTLWRLFALSVINLVRR